MVSVWQSILNIAGISLNADHSAAVRAQTYLMVKLEGGGGSAKAAAAVTELLCRGDDCQLGLNRAIRGAQRNHRDATEQRRDKEKYVQQKHERRK